jgi:L-alanine-DL-glutamate epimerase-like enolase superfamily enzyme
VAQQGKIDRIELFHVDVPLPTPFFPIWIPGYPQNQQRFTLLKVTTRDGLVGHATGTAFDREREGLGEMIGAFLLGIDAYDVGAVAERLRQASLLGWSNAWMEVAFWDLAAQARGVPVYELILERLAPTAKAGARPSTVDAYASFAELRPPAARAEAIERALRLGFSGVKLCVQSAEEPADLQQLRAARKAAGQGFPLMVHAHQASSLSLVQEVKRWDLARAERFAMYAREQGVMWIQEPLLLEPSAALRTLSQKGPVPIAGGDTATSAALLSAMAELGCLGVLTPDVSFLGLSGVVSVIAECHRRGLSFSPHSYGDGLSLLANFHALVAWAAISGQRPWLEFPWEPPAIIPEQRDAILSAPIHTRADGKVVVPTGPGLGVGISARALRRYGKRFYNLTPVRFMVASARRQGLRQTAAVSQPGRVHAVRRRRHALG